MKTFRRDTMAKACCGFRKVMEAVLKAGGNVSEHIDVI
jgi:hypothetical protein